MGADFIYKICEWPRLENGETARPTTELQNILLERLKEALQDDDVLTDLEIEGVIYLEEADNEAEQMRLYEWAKDFIVYVFGAENWPIDCGMLGLEGKEYLLTGGMSWGDDPTESFQYVAFLDAVGITKEPVELKEGGKND